MDVNTARFSPINARKFKLASPPQKSEASAQVNVPTETFTFSGAVDNSGGKSNTSTLKKVGIGLALAGAVGGAFVAGGIMNQPPAEVTTESSFEDFGRVLDRGLEDLSTDWKRGVEDFKREYNRGYEDAGGNPDAATQRQRDREDAKVELQREIEDTKKDLGRKWNDFWGK